MEPDAGIGRRRFVNWFLGTWLGTLAAWVVYPILRFMSPPETAEAATQQVEIGLTTDPELMTRGFKIVAFGPDPVIVVRVGEGDYRAFSATCTHLDCVVEFRSTERLLWCNCHNGHFDLDGKVVGGPPPRPLEAFSVHVLARGEGKASVILVSRKA